MVLGVQKSGPCGTGVVTGFLTGNQFHQAKMGNSNNLVDHPFPVLTSTTKNRGDLFLSESKALCKNADWLLRPPDYLEVHHLDKAVEFLELPGHVVRMSLTGDT